MLTAYHCYPGHWIHFNAALTMHNVHSLGSIPYLAAHDNVLMVLAIQTQSSFESYRVPINTPGSRSAIWIICLTERYKCMALVEFKPGLAIYHNTVVAYIKGGGGATVS